MENSHERGQIMRIGTRIGLAVLVSLALLPTLASTALATTVIADAKLTTAVKGGWSRTLDSRAFNGGYLKSDGLTAMAGIGYNCKSLTWLATKGPDMGYAQVYVDGQFKGVVDLYARNLTFMAPIYTQTWSATGTHYISLTSAGAKRAASSGTAISVDAFKFIY
jgi:hypothetical protein